MLFCWFISHLQNFIPTRRQAIILYLSLLNPSENFLKQIFSWIQFRSFQTDIAWPIKDHCKCKSLNAYIWKSIQVTKLNRGHVKRARCNAVRCLGLRKGHVRLVMIMQAACDPEYSSPGNPHLSWDTWRHGHGDIAAAQSIQLCTSLMNKAGH